MNLGSFATRKNIGAILVVIAVLQLVSLYYSPLIQVQRTKTLDTVQIYTGSIRSVVTVRSIYAGFTITPVLGTGFVIAHNNSFYIVTNFHVIDSVRNTTVTFSNGNSYGAEVIGSDAYSDLAVLATKAPSTEFAPMQLGVSSALKVGEQVAAIGNPHGLLGSITVGIVSQVGRTVPVETSGSFPIADTIQFSAAINPGNSGGPLINADGMVVGITTAIFANAQGLGFAIPSDTIVREIPYLITNGKYDKHPYLGAQLDDMNYQLSQAMKTSVTWGALIRSTVPDGPANRSGLRGGTQIIAIEGQRYVIGGDIIVSIDGNKILNYDMLSTYLQRHVIAGQKIQVEIIRLGRQMVVTVEVGTRPPIK